MKYCVCKRCVMDTSAKEIVFDKNGYCNFCTVALDEMPQKWTVDEQKLDELYNKIKKAGEGRQYDCIIGISGGIDSSYLAYVSAKKGLRMLGIHIDAGFNTPVSERNVKNLCEKLGIDLKIIKIDLTEMMDLQRAYFLSEVLNQDVPQDHAFFSALFKYAKENKIKYFLTGSNYSSESILPISWRYNAYDGKNLKAIHKAYGRVKLETYPVMSFYEAYIKYDKLKKVHPLDLIDYNKEEAIKILAQEIGFEYYGAKHCESSFTRLFQSYILPKKFGIDKRRCHLSSLIVAGQLSRDDALEELSHPLCTDEQIESDIQDFISKIDITREQFDRIVDKKGGKRHEEFKHQGVSLKLLKGIRKIFGINRNK